MNEWRNERRHGLNDVTNELVVVLTAIRRGRGSAPERCACPGCGARPSTLCTLKHRGLNSPSRGLKQNKVRNKIYITLCVVHVCMYASRYSLLESQSAQTWRACVCGACVYVCVQILTVRITVSTDVVALDLSYRGTGCRVDTRITTVLQTNTKTHVKPWFMTRILCSHFT